jgi:benzylsuccinate CoA-transferase BbsF subunit
MDNWGLSYEEIRKFKADVIAVAMPMGGTSGPYREFKGFGSAIAGMAGFPPLMGFADRPPRGTGTTYTDFTAGPIHAATATLAALHYRDVTGRGQFIEVSQFESAVSFVGTALLSHLAGGPVPNPPGNSSPHAAPHGVYRCKGTNRWCAIAVYTEDEWQSLVVALGNPAWADGERFNTFEGRKANEQELEHHIEQWTIELAPHEVMQRLQSHGVPAVAVQTIEDLMVDDSQMKIRHHYHTLHHSEAGDMTYEEPIYKLAGIGARLRSPAPIIGQHTDYICRDVLGLTESEMNQLMADRVIF